MVSRGSVTGAGLLVGWMADQVFGDPRRWHPVAGFGRVAAAVESRTYADGRTPGVVHEIVLVGSAVGLGVALTRLATRWPAR